jgi:hypothetical protein
MTQSHCSGNLIGDMTPDHCFFCYRGRCCHSVSKFWWFLAYPCGMGKWYRNCIGGYHEPKKPIALIFDKDLNFEVKEENV